MKKLIIVLLMSPMAFAHPGHDHEGMLAHGVANPDLAMMLFLLFAASCAWALGLLKRDSR